MALLNPLIVHERQQLLLHLKIHSKILDQYRLGLKNVEDGQPVLATPQSKRQLFSMASRVGYQCRRQWSCPAASRDRLSGRFTNLDPMISESMLLFKYQLTGRPSIVHFALESYAEKQQHSFKRIFRH